MPFVSDRFESGSQRNPLIREAAPMCVCGGGGQGACSAMFSKTRVKLLPWDLFYHLNTRHLCSSVPHHLVDPLKTGTETSSPTSHSALQCLVHNCAQYLRNEWLTMGGWNPRKINKIKQKKGKSTRGLCSSIFPTNNPPNLIISEPESTGVKGINCSHCRRHINSLGLLRAI